MRWSLWSGRKHVASSVITLFFAILLSPVLDGFNYIKPKHCPHSKQCGCWLISRRQQENLGNALTENRSWAGWMGSMNATAVLCRPPITLVSLFVQSSIFIIAFEQSKSTWFTFLNAILDYFLFSCLYWTIPGILYRLSLSFLNSNRNMESSKNLGSNQESLV